MPLLRRTGSKGMTEEARLKRRESIGGSDARIIMSGDQDAIELLWRQKRGEVPETDMSDVLLVRMGVVMEDLVLDWFEDKTGLFVTNEQERCVHPDYAFATCTLDGKVRESLDGPVVGIMEAKFMMPYGWSLEAAIEKYQAQFQWNSFVTQEDRIWGAIITGAASFAQIEIEADPFYQLEMLRAVEDFWDCVHSGRTPGNPKVTPPTYEPTGIVDMSTSNSWSNFADILCSTKESFDNHELAKKEIKKLVPPDAKVAHGKGIKFSRSSNNRLVMSFD